MGHNIDYEETTDGMNTKLAKRYLQRIKKLVTSTGSCVLALSGGNTPLSLYSELSELLSSETSSVQNNLNIIQVDERFVSKNHPRSNGAKLRTIFPNSCNVKRIPSMSNVDTVEQSAKAYSGEIGQLLRMINKEGPDICLLGMGTDGHTASLFPKSVDFSQPMYVENLYIPVHEETVEDPRISMSPQFIKSSKYLDLLIYGSDKGKTLQEAFSGDYSHYPISYFLDDLNIYCNMDAYQQFHK